MLRGLFGSKSVERILLFMLVNERAYATQLHRMLNTPLTPIQKALKRLEGDGILKCVYEGKTRLYFFDPDYPLLDELEALLKKAYVKLAPSEKKITTMYVIFLNRINTFSMRYGKSCRRQAV